MYLLYASITALICYLLICALVGSTRKKTVVVLYGGGKESEISKLSAMNVSSLVLQLEYNLSLMRVELDELPKNFYQTNSLEDDLLQIDNPVVLNMVHGEWGEDGQAQQMLNRLNIPYFGSSVFGSRLNFYKNEFYEYVSRNEITKVPKWDFLNKKEYLDSKWAIKFPHIVKTPDSGSSIGVYFIENPAEVIKLSTLWDDESRMIIQEFIPGIEVGLAMLDGRVIGGVIPKHSGPILTYDNKYGNHSSELVSIEELESELKETLYKEAETSFNRCGCSGFVLAEFRLGEDNEWFLLEFNTVPGMTKKSYIPNSFGKAKQIEMVKMMLSRASKKGSIFLILGNILKNLLLLRPLNVFSKRLIKRLLWVNLS